MMLSSYLDEFMWRECHESTASTALASLCRDIALKYPVCRFDERIGFRVAPSTGPHLRQFLLVYFTVLKQLSKSCHSAMYTANFVRPGCNQFVHNPLPTHGYFAGQ